METVRFDELNLDERILRAVTDMGFEAASPIQAQSIPVQAEGPRAMPTATASA